jgi:hypothetical protein
MLTGLKLEGGSWKPEAGRPQVIDKNKKNEKIENTYRPVILFIPLCILLF